MRDIIPLERGNYYHLFTRGINSENIFKREENYTYFLNKWIQNVTPVADTLAYCLLKNHFHFLIQIKEAEYKIIGKDGIEYVADPTKQLSHMLNGYAQGFNKVYKRTGGLFENPFRRKLIDNQVYMREVIAYIHFNPQHHDFINDFKIYEHSSYQKIISTSPSFINKDEAIKPFGSIEKFILFHSNYKDSKSILLES